VLEYLAQTAADSNRVSIIPISGYIDGAEHLERTAAGVEYVVGKGHVVLIGFRAQHRAQPHRTFKLLFNSLFFGGLESANLGD
jgi:hypothetical protein